MIRTTAKLSAMFMALSVGCSSPEPDPELMPDVAAPDVRLADVGVTDVATGDGGSDVTRPVDMPEQPLDPDDYCELTADLFCPYYLRCGRIAAADRADCERNFIETCNAAYEPQYAAIADRGDLVLSASGIEACRDHLEAVECSRHVFDLDGPCSNIWVGQAASGAPCAPGIGSFVCGAGTECVLDLSLCGTCEPAGSVGEACVDNRCVNGATCISETCVARGLPSDSCDDERLCVTGIGCDAGTCRAQTIVTVGDACDGARRCPYQSTCRGSVCVQDALLGESCTDASCASAWCDGSICREFVTPGSACGEAFQCLSGRCEGGVCREPVSACFGA